jgi:hypothetical protein
MKSAWTAPGCLVFAVDAVYYRLVFIVLLNKCHEPFFYYESDSEDMYICLLFLCGIWISVVIMVKVLHGHSTNAA